MFIINSKEIQDVAIYLRKSRGESEDDLSKHKETLVEYAEKMRWKYKIYSEGIISGDGLSGRVKMLTLLDDVEKGLYDAVLVMDYDRLSRGSKKEQGIIESILKDSGTKIATPTRLYDLEDDGDDTAIEVEGLVARLEYKTIKRRLKQGKERGAKNGAWVNGKPPYPYYYVRETKEVMIDNEKRKIYRMIVDKYLTGKAGTQEIAVWLNKQGIQSPGGRTWKNNAVKRLLIHEFHMGKVIYGKEKWAKTPDGKRYVKTKRDNTEIFVGVGNHERLKTMEEHEKILQILSTNNKIPRKSRAGAFPTSGLLYCKKCGRRMSYSEGRVEKRTGKKYDYTKCGKVDDYGVRCTQKGVKMDEDFYNALYQTILSSYMRTEHLDQLNEDNHDKQELQELLQLKENEIESAERAIENIFEAFETGVIKLKEFDIRKKKYEDKLNRLKKEIDNLRRNLESLTRYSPVEIQSLMNSFEANWENATTSKEKNQLLKSLVKRIDYDRNEDTITFEIEYR